MMDGRSPRTYPALTLWTLVLIGLVLAEVRHLPPGLTVLLVPYLALMARHWIGRLRKRDHIEPLMPLDNAAERPSDDEPHDRTDSTGSDGRADCDDPAQPVSPGSAEGQATPSTRRGRARRVLRVPEVEPHVASWVQVQPGRFVRVEEVSPGHPADESGSESRPDEPYEAAPLDVPGTPLEAISIPADGDADVPESQIQIEVPAASQDTTGVTAQSDR
jgi:hypothetical protein